MDEKVLVNLLLKILKINVLVKKNEQVVLDPFTVAAIVSHVCQSVIF